MTDGQFMVPPAITELTMTEPTATTEPPAAPPLPTEKRAEKGADRARSWHKTMPDGPWDTIVIGSGIGGMTSAALLAELGDRVLVLEQHYVPGGFTHAFRRKGSRNGWIWDVGVHAVGEVTKHSMPGRLLAHLTGDRLQWESLGPVYDDFAFPDDFRIGFPDTPKQFRANMLAAFPDEEAAIDGYLAKVKEVSAGMKGYYLARTLPRWAAPIADRTIGRKAHKFLEVTTKEVLDGLTDNVELKAVLASQWGYYGSTPSRSSFAMQALVAKHFMYGGYYPVGGSPAIAEELLRSVADRGGWCRIRASVKEIRVENGRATGVELDDGEFIPAGRVISAAGVQSTVTRLLPETHAKSRWARSIAELSPAPCHVCLYIGFRGDIRNGGASAANRWFYDTWDSEDGNWPVSAEQETLPPAAVLYCSFPSLKDPDYDPGQAQRHTGEVVTFVPWEAFAQWQGTDWSERGAEYEQFKQKMHDTLLEQFLQKMPELRRFVAFSELSTPLSTDHFCRPMKGSIYGIEPTPKRFRNPHLRPVSPIKNLYFGGSEVSTVGVIGAMMGGVLAATAAEPRKATRLLRSL